jgi:hypothetical protein
LINPRDKAPAIGWDAVKKDWQDGVFGFWAELKLSPKQAPHIRVDQTTAWTTGVVGVRRQKQGAVSLSALPSSRRRFTKSAAIAGSWFLTTHSGCQNNRADEVIE